MMIANILIIFTFFFDQSICFLVTKNPPKHTRNSIFMSDDKNLFDQMRKSLGETEDMFAQSEKESKQLLQGLRDMDRDPKLKTNSRFIEWLDENGVWVKQQSAWGKAPHPLVISSNTVDEGETCGRGLLARESIGEGELLMTIPLDLCLTRAVAQEVVGKDVIPDYIDEYIAIAILLMSEKLKGTASRWKPYIDILPDVGEVYPSFLWAEEELEMLKGSPCYSASKSLRKKLEKEYSTTMSDVLSRHANKLPLQKFTIDIFMWAFVMLFSRAARLTSKSSGEELALVPYADLMNHNPYSNTYIDAERSGLPFLSKTENVALYTDRAYKQFEQVFINYGEKSNADLLLLYGFSLDRNPFNAVDVTIGLSREDPMYGQKKAYLDKAGRGVSSVRFPLQGNRYPSELVDFLRLLLVEPEDIGMQSVENVDFNEPISPSLERRVLLALEDICKGYLSAYPTTLTEDEALMVDKGMFSALTRQQRMAVRLRASEKRILMRTIQAVQEEYAKLPSVVSTVGDKIVAAGRSFDTYDARPTVATAKSMNDWVELRDKKEEGGPSQAAAEEESSVVERRRRRRVGRQ